ncbi:FG-GAP-like repeat-containing protein [Streptomyces zhihengii]
MSEEDKALQEAQSSGAPVELLSARTEASDTWALPDGSFSIKQHGTVVRLFRQGAWVPADPTLQFASDGSVVPRATSVAVKFSGGGTGPMLTGVKDGRTLSLTWPKPLPTPTLEANVATYGDVLPGVDLQLKADVEGFSQLLVVKTAQAADNPELAELQFTMGTVGVTMDEDADTGMLTATDPAGQTIFTSPAPIMWDSAPPAGPALRTAAAANSDPAPAPGDVFEPGAGSEDAQMATEISGDTLTITPDQELLTGTETTYPVYIDPSWAWGEWQHWTRVYEAYPNNSYWDAKGDVRVGYESQTGGQDRVSRSFFQLDTSDVEGAQIKDATFRIRNTWSWSCDERIVELYHTGDISRKTTWNRQPARIGTALSSVNDSKGWGEGCDAGDLEFDATRAVRTAAADSGDASVTLGLYAADESDTFGWKRFDPKTATLEIVYNNKPEPPSNLGTNPRTSCTAGGTVGNATVSLHAKIEDKNGGALTARFRVYKTGSATPVIDSSVAAVNRRVSTLVLPAADTPTGDYTWTVTAKDSDGLESQPSDTCKLAIDRKRPSKPPVITSEVKTYPARSTGVFRFTSDAQDEVVAYYFWTDTQPGVREIAASAATANIYVSSYGPHMVYAYSVDEAGNRSDTATYLFYAERGQERDQPGDLNGDGFKDIWSTDTNGTLLSYAGRGNKEFSAATNGGSTFPSSQVSFSTDWGEDGYNDLVSLEYNPNAGKSKLLVYPNEGEGVIDPAGPNVKELTVSCPVPRGGRCKGEEGWTGDDHWYNAEQVVAGGDLNADEKGDLLVKQGKHLWVYYGDRSTKLDNIRPRPVLVGETDWDRFTLISPGDLNGDGIPDLILRENSTGDLYRSYGSKDPHGVLDAATWGNAAGRVKIATGVMPQSAYATIGTSGDLDGDGNGDGIQDGDGIPDLWGRKGDNSLVGWPGRKTGSDYSGIGAAFLIDGVNGGRQIPAGTSLTSGQSVASTTARLTMKPEGNLVITSNAGKELWSSGAPAAEHAGAKALVHANGDIGLYKGETFLKSATGITATTPGLAEAGYALLQDRGNLVVSNASGQSVWSSGTAIRHDYNRDGRSDIAAWYDYGDGSDRLHSFTTNSDGTFTAPTSAWSAGAGHYVADSMKRTTGDFNGDGIGDIAAFYGHDDGEVNLRTWLGKPDGTFQAPFVSWTVAPGNWHFPHFTVHSGDFNGDGRDDIATWYAYADGSDRLFTFTANLRGGFNAPAASFYRAEGWHTPNMKFATGDYNGDGRDDLAAWYRFDTGVTRLYTFIGKPSGSFSEPVAGWSDANWGSLERTSVHSGDFNGDGRDDIATWYDYGDGHDAVISFNPSGPDGTFGNRKEIWSAEAGNYFRNNMKIVSGDYNGDGRDDLGAMYGYADGSVKMLTWTAKADGTLNERLEGWLASPGNWVFDRVSMIERYSPA